MLDLGRIMVSESAKKKLVLRRTCKDCNQHIREAKHIQSSLLPTKGLCHEVIEIVFRFKPFSDVGGDFVDFFSLSNGFIGMYLGDVVGKGLASAMFAALVMGTLRGGSQDRDGHRERSYSIERAPLTATQPWAFLFHFVRGFQPGHAGTRLLHCRNATTTAGFRNGVSTAWRRWVALGVVPWRHLRTSLRTTLSRRLHSVRDRRSSRIA
jgi:hypothetical protein